MSEKCNNACMVGAKCVHYTPETVCFHTIACRDDKIQKLQAELDRHTHTCSKCGNYLLPYDDSHGTFSCPCCAIDNLQAQLANLRSEVRWAWAYYENDEYYNMAAAFKRIMKTPEQGEEGGT